MNSHARHSRLEALQRQIRRLDSRLLYLDRLSRNYSRLRTALIIAGICCALAAERFLGSPFSWLTLGLFVAAFAVAAAWHRRVRRSSTRHAAWKRIKSTHVARLTHDWANIPQPPDASLEPEHPFAADINLTGRRSVHHFLDTSSSYGGSARLRSWLLNPLVTPAAVRGRQQIVRELVPLSRFRDRLTLHGILLGGRQQERWTADKVADWLMEEAPPRLTPWVWGLGLLAFANIVLGALYTLGHLPPVWIASLLLYLALYTYKHRDAGSLFAHAYQLERVLRHLRAVLVYLENFPYARTPHLADLCEPYWRPANRPSVSLRKIARIAGAAGVQQSHLLGFLVNIVVPWDLFFADRLNRYKEWAKDVLPVWIDRWYDLEALSSLATHSYLNPDGTFPEIMSQEDGPILQAHALGHPLLSENVRVYNDFSFDRLGEIALITGSNMSGKSTFLRTLGVNLCLAYAGASVHAQKLQTVPLRLFTCIQVADSVTDGISYFYAEVRRLKALLDALNCKDGPPLLFLIDEIFRGTNNHERLAGSRDYIRALAKGRGVGTISTHDLELIGMAEDVPGIHNFHFREEISAGQMVFDYRLRPGPCPTTNALKIMRMAGLPVSAVGEP
ncbi:MAG: hypothetical protein OXC69_03720 [Candidatus Tectomicrobia bacterium]|nr:hypothetical protein [Candidatus Tectomicrobia bacterium]